MLQTTYVRRSKDAPLFIENFRPGHYFEEEIFFPNQKKKTCLCYLDQTNRAAAVPSSKVVYIYI